MGFDHEGLGAGHGAAADTPGPLLTPAVILQLQQQEMGGRPHVQLRTCALSHAVLSAGACTFILALPGL